MGFLYEWMRLWFGCRVWGRWVFCLKTWAQMAASPSSFGSLFIRVHPSIILTKRVIPLPRSPVLSACAIERADKRENVALLESSCAILDLLHYCQPLVNVRHKVGSSSAWSFWPFVVRLREHGLSLFSLFNGSFFAGSRTRYYKVNFIEQVGRIQRRLLISYHQCDVFIKLDLL